MDWYDSFPKFTNLPFELRTKIWRHAFPGPRVIPVRYSRTQDRYISDRPPQALLRVCPESRSVFLSTYENLIISPTHKSSVFVDFQRDTVFFDDLSCSPRGDLALDLASSPHREKILQCAIDAQLWEVLRVFRYDTVSEIKLLTNLRTFSLVLRQDYDRGLRQTRTSNNGVLVEVDSDTVGSEIQHVHWYVETLRGDLELDVGLKWLSGQPPSIQMWIW
jgi:2EXR family